MAERRGSFPTDTTEAQANAEGADADKAGIRKIREEMRFVSDEQFLGMERGILEVEVRQLQEEIAAWERAHEDDQLEIRVDELGVPKDRELPVEIQRKTRELWRKNELRAQIADAEQAAASGAWQEVAQFYQHRRTQLDDESLSLQAELVEATARYRRARQGKDAREVVATGKDVAELDARLKAVAQLKEEYADRHAQVRVLIDESRGS